jgi:NitT/TauT family transport system ATP-binding protein
VVVLACDPGRVATDIAVDLPKDRDLAVKRLPAFLTLRAQVEDEVRTYHYAA